MKLQQLLYFEAVCRLGSVSKAAAELSVSQPAISASIRELENEFSVPLFLRVGKSMQLTQEGHTFLKLSRELLDRAENTTQIMHDLAKNRNHLRLGMSPMIAAIYLPRILKNFSTQFPEVELTVVEDGIYTLQKKMESRELDIVLNSIGPSVDPQTYHTIKVCSFDWCFCTNANNRFANRESLKITEIEQEPMVSFHKGHHASRLEAHFAEFGCKPNVVYHTDQLSTALQLIRFNDMSALIHAPLAQSNPDLRFIPLDPRIIVGVHLIWRRDSYVYSDMEKLIRCILEMGL